MDFKDYFKQLSERIPKLKEQITTARIKGLPFDELQELESDIEQIRTTNV